MRLAFASLLASSSLAVASACTALAVDGDASATGAAFSIENVDCSNCDFRLAYVPPRDHPENIGRPVYLQKANYPRWVGYGRGEIYHPVDGQEAFKAALHIPQVSHTYGYYESACPLMNDKGLGIAESSCAAMLLNKAPDAGDNRSVPVAYLDAAALMQLVLERCSTARCGAELMGELVEKHGYLPFFGEPTAGSSQGKPEWDDAGEGYTLADASGETWVVHVLGGVDGILKSAWAAQRVPKGHIVVIANTFVIGELPEEPNEDYLFSKDLRRAALSAKLWDGKGRFDFSRVFAPDFMEGSAPSSTIPIPLYSALRKWRLLNLAAPSLKLKMENNALDLPFSVKVERKLTRRDVMEMMRDHYAGTEFDMTQGMLAGPWGSPFRAEGGPKFANVPRGISIMRSIYSTIAETGPDGAVVWFAPDTAATSVYMPLDSRVGSLSPIMHTGNYLEFSRESAFWVFDYVNNWMQLGYQKMMSEDVKPRLDKWQDRLDAEYEAIISRKAGLEEVGDWQTKLQDEILRDWWKLAEQLIVKWNDFERADEQKLGASWAYPDDFAQMVGMSNDVHPLWVKPVAKPEVDVQGYVGSTIKLPRGWDYSTRTWIQDEYPKPEAAATMALAEARINAHTGIGPISLAAVASVVFLAGSVSGYFVGRRQTAKLDSYQQPLL